MWTKGSQYYRSSRSVTIVFLFVSVSDLVLPLDAVRVTVCLLLITPEDPAIVEAAAVFVLCILLLSLDADSVISNSSQPSADAAGEVWVLTAAECLLKLYAGNECGLCSILVAINDCEAISCYCSLLNCCGVIQRSCNDSLLYYWHL